MTKRRLLRWSLLFVFLAAFAVWLEPTRVVWGWLRGEAFYQGRPTSWWADELGRWDMHMQFAMGGLDGKRICMHRLIYERTDTKFEEFWKRLLRIESQPEPPGCLTGDAAAVDVLQALAEHSSEQVRKMARLGLRKTGQPVEESDE